MGVNKPRNKQLEHVLGERSTFTTLVGCGIAQKGTFHLKEERKAREREEEPALGVL